MIGILRTTLAFLVFDSHIPNFVVKLNVGVLSVTLFYFISGLLMERSYRRFRDSSRHPALTFWLDRVIRIWPCFAAVVLTTALLIHLFGTGFVVWFPPDVSLGNVLGNLTVFCLNFEGWWDGKDILLQSWSLATEAQFYVLVPLLLILPFGFLAAALFLSMGFQLYCHHAMDVETASFWAYRMLPGTLFYFCMGICYARRADLRYHRLLWAAVVTQFALLIVVYPFSHPFQNSYIMEGWIGSVIAVPLVDFVERQGQSWRRWDRLIGDFCYPIFLTHFLAMDLANLLRTGEPTSFSWVISAVLLCLLLSAALIWLVQMPTDRLRIALRGFRSPGIPELLPSPLVGEGAERKRSG